jgi:hypothetical protein
VQTGDSQWVFESSDPAVKIINATDSRFFWMAMYVQPLLWIGLAILAMVKLEFIWLTLVGMLCCSVVPIENFGRWEFGSAKDELGAAHWIGLEG